MNYIRRFAYLRKVNTRFVVLSISSSASKTRPALEGFQKYLYLKIFPKTVEKIMIDHNQTRITGILHKDKHIFSTVSR